MPRPLKHVPFGSPDHFGGGRGVRGVPFNATDRRRAGAPPCGWRDLDWDRSGVKSKGMKR